MRLRRSSLPMYLLTFIVIVQLLNLMMMQMLQPYSSGTEHPECPSSEIEKVASRALSETWRKLSRDWKPSDVIEEELKEKRGTPIALDNVNSDSAHQVAGREFPLRREDVTVVGMRRKPGFLTIGIPTVYRKDSGVSYLQQTLDSFISNTAPSERDNVIILVFVADTNQIYRQEVLDFLQATYREHLESGFLLVATVRPEAYPTLTGLKRNFNDSQERVKWRSKQALDVSFTFYVGRILGEYYLHIEDDTVTSPGYIRLIKEFIESRREPWTALSFSSLFSVGRLFRSTDVDRLAKFLYMFYDEAPFDWLFHHYFSVVSKPPDFRVPSIFQTIGSLSSLPGKNMSEFKDLSFIGDLTRRTAPKGFPDLSLNPPARLYTSIVPFQYFLPACAYTDPGPFFWGVYPHGGQTFSVVFDESLRLEKLYIQTGHIRHPLDTLKKAEVLACYRVLEEPSTHFGEPLCTGCIKIGDFTSSELREEHLDTAIPFPVSCLRIVLTNSHWNWVLINQILVVPSTAPIDAYLKPAPPSDTIGAAKLRQVKGRKVPPGGWKLRKPRQ